MEFKKHKLGEFIDTISDTTSIKKNKVILINTSDIENGKVLNHIYSENKNLKGQFKKRFKKGDILYSEIRPKNRRFAYIDFDSEDYIASTKLMVLRNKGNIDNDFLFQLLKSESIINYLQIMAESRSGTFPQITFNELSNTDVYVPEIIVQRKISKFLKLIDKKIELNNQINDNLLVLGKTLFKNWVSSCTDELYIYEMAEEILDYTKSKNKYIKILNSSDITENNFAKTNFIENKNLKGHFKKRFNKFDILYSQIRPRNHHYGYSLIDDTDNYIISTRLMVIRNKPEVVSSSLLYFYLTSEDAINDFTTKTESRSGTFPQGNYQDLSSLKVKYSKDQQKITKCLDNILEKIYKNNLNNQVLEQLRDTLLPKLMNGEIDVDKVKI